MPGSRSDEPALCISMSSSYFDDDDEETFDVSILRLLIKGSSSSSPSSSAGLLASEAGADAVDDVREIPLLTESPECDLRFELEGTSSGVDDEEDEEDEEDEGNNRLNCGLVGSLMADTIDFMCALYAVRSPLTRAKMSSLISSASLEANSSFECDGASGRLTEAIRQIGRAHV